MFNIQLTGYTLIATTARNINIIYVNVYTYDCTLHRNLLKLMCI